MGISDLHLTDEGAVNGRFLVPEEFKGHVVAHGGWIAWVFDETLGLLPRGLGEWGITSQLSIRYLRPVPIGAEIVMTAWLESKKDRTWTIAGEMRLAGAGTLLASAEGDWIVLEDPDVHYERAREWCYQITGRREP